MTGISRRGFLKGMLGLAAAPAICKAENLMKIFVPNQELIIPDQKLGRGITESIVHIDELGFFGGDYDGDALNFNIIDTSQGLTQRILSEKHFSPDVLARQQMQRKEITDYVNRSSLLKQRLAGKSAYVSRSPLGNNGVLVSF